MVSSPRKACTAVFLVSRSKQLTQCYIAVKAIIIGVRYNNMQESVNVMAKGLRTDCLHITIYK